MHVSLLASAGSVPWGTCCGPALFCGSTSKCRQDCSQGEQCTHCCAYSILITISHSCSMGPGHRWIAWVSGHMPKRLCTDYP